MLLLINGVGRGGVVHGQHLASPPTPAAMNVCDLSCYHLPLCRELSVASRCGAIRLFLAGTTIPTIPQLPRSFYVSFLAGAPRKQTAKERWLA